MRRVLISRFHTHCNKTLQEQKQHSGVLKGAGHYLRERIVCVTAEKFEGIYEGGHTDEQLLDFMSSSGFQLVSEIGLDFNFVNLELASDWLADAECCFGCWLVTSPYGITWNGIQCTC
mmetsp:Transcript_71338/g.115720  ORF Transcript_71338/g.115720 Transcript_71338/m.115720 type:complete len:118 (+) Transcript_71338:49-402(+)